MNADHLKRPLRAADVLNNGLDPETVLHLDAHFGNEELIHALGLLGVAGPFHRLSPWELSDEGGERLITAAGYAAMPFGEMPPELTEFMSEFLQKNTAMTLPQQSASVWRAALSANLIELLARELPSHHDSGVFFCSSGTEAVEGALKFARAWRKGAAYTISFKGAYHGKTYGSLSLTPNPEYQDAFRPLVPGALTSPYGDLEALRTLLRRVGPRNVAAIVVEPIQGEGGVIIPPPEFLPGLNEICREHGIVCIADEIQTGLGRTGHYFESAAQGLDPDIITLAKPLGGGLVAVGATIVRRRLYRHMLGGLASKRHSNTFGGGALAMAVGLRSLELITDGNLPERSLKMGQEGLLRLRALQARFPQLLREVRGQGLLLAMEFQPPLAEAIDAGLPQPLRELSHEAISILALKQIQNAGVMANLSLSSKRTVRLSPALNMPEALFDEMLGRIERFAEATENSANIVLNTPAETLLKISTFAVLPPRARGHKM